MAASAGAVRAGRAFVEIFADDSRLVRGLRRAQRRMQAFGQSVQQIGVRMFALGTSMAAPFALAVKAASDAEQTMQKFRAVFKDSADEADRFAVALGKSIGRAPTDIRNSLSAFQAFFVGLGFGGKQATEFSTQLQSLMHDFAAFFNITDDEAMQRFVSALAGSPQVLDQFGINIRAATIEAELLAMGIKKSAQEATEQEKTIARLAIIMRALTDQGAVGAAVREVNTFEGQMRRMRSMIRQVAVEVGEALLPVLTPLVSRLGAWAEAIGRIAKQNPGLVKSIAALAAGLMAVGAVLIAAGTAGLLLSGILGALATAFTVLTNPITLVAAGLVGLIGYAMHASGALDALKMRAVEAFRGISDAMMSGDLALAGKIGLLALKIEWIRFVNFLKGLWEQFTIFFGTIFDLAVARAAKSMVSIIEELKKFQGILSIVAPPLAIALDQIEIANPAQVRGEIDAMARQRMAQREARAGADIAQAQADLEAAKEEFREAREQAARQRREAEGRLADVPEIGAGGFDRMAAAVGAERQSVVGTFNARVARSLGTGDPLSQIADSNKKIEKNTDKLVTKAQQGKLTWQ